MEINPWQSFLYKTDDSFDLYYFWLYNNKYSIILYTKKCLSTKLEGAHNRYDISQYDMEQLAILLSWLNAEEHLNQDNIYIYLYIKLQAESNKEFLDWWKYYNFQKILFKRWGNKDDYYRDKDTAKVS